MIRSGGVATLRRMGFLGVLFKKESNQRSSVPIDLMKERVEEHPTDARLAYDLANALQVAGDLEGAQEYACRAAEAHSKVGFATKALAVLKGAMLWGKPSVEVLQALANVHIALKHKEDARGALIQLRKAHVAAGNSSELGRIDAQLQELGPSR